MLSVLGQKALMYPVLQIIAGFKTIWSFFGHCKMGDWICQSDETSLAQIKLVRTSPTPFSP